MPPIPETWLHHDDTATSSVNIVSKLTEREPALRTCSSHQAGQGRQRPSCRQAQEGGHWGAALVTTRIWTIKCGKTLFISCCVFTSQTYYCYIMAMHYITKIFMDWTCDWQILWFYQLSHSVFIKVFYPKVLFWNILHSPLITKGRNENNFPHTAAFSRRVA